MEIKFECEVITPMFMAGADGKTPELRPSEFKGMMRFWWRAIKAEDNIPKLLKEETEIFGGTGEGEGRSKVKIRISNPLPDDTMIGASIKEEIEYKEKRDNKEYAGLRYLFYSTYALQSGKPYIKTPYKFDVILSSSESLNNYYQHGLASLWLSIYLGGFGTRARRGGGNIVVTKVVGDSGGINFIPDKIDTKKKLKDWLENNLKTVKNKISSQKTNKYSNLTGARILIFDHKPSWIDALNLVGEQFKDFRKENKSDIWKTAAFGMPVMHNKFTIRMLPYRDNTRLSERMGSPIIFKVIKSGNLYFPLIIKLNTDIGWVGKEERIGNRWGKANRNDVKPINFSKVDEFIIFMKKCVEEIRL